MARRIRRVRRAKPRTVIYKRANPWRAWAGMSRVPLGVRNKHGALAIQRKLPLINISQGAALGTITTSDPTGSLLTLGTPSLVAGTTNCYNVPFVMKFRLSQILNYTDITNLCDRYKITAALLKLHNNFQNVNTNNNLLLQPYVEYIQDYDDATVPPTVNVFREKMGIKTKYFTASKPSIGMGVKPRYRMDVGNDWGGGTALALIGNRKQWLNTTYPEVDHYGIKGILHNVFLPGGGLTNGSVFDLECSLKVVAKDFQ